MRQLFKSTLTSEFSRGITVSVVIHAAALVGVGGMLISPPRPIGAASHLIEIELSQEAAPEPQPAPVATKFVSAQEAPPEKNEVAIRTSDLKTKILPALSKPPPPFAQTNPQKLVVKETIHSPSAAVVGNSFRNVSESLDNLVPASSTWSPKPPYPFAAREAKFEGRVLLAVGIDTAGHPKHGKVVASSGRTDCDEVALNTVLERWRFTPATIFGRAVEWEQKIEVEYRLR